MLLFPHAARFLLYNGKPRKEKCSRKERKYQAPIAVRIADARTSAQWVTSSARSASTITRALGSVPEYRTTTRPAAPSVFVALSIAAETTGRDSSGGLDFTMIFRRVCGNA